MEGTVSEFRRPEEDFVLRMFGVTRFLIWPFLLWRRKPMNDEPQNIEQMRLGRTIGAGIALLLVTQTCWLHAGCWKDARIDKNREQEIRKIWDFVIQHT